MLDAHAAHLVVVGDALLAREVAHDLGLLGALDVLVGDVMIGARARSSWDRTTFSTPILRNSLTAMGAGNVVGQHEVEIAFDQLTRLHFVEPRMGGEDLLRHGHGTWHVCSFVRWVLKPAHAQVHGKRGNCTTGFCAQEEEPRGALQREAIFQIAVAQRAS